MYPDRSFFNSGEGGSAWWTWINPDGVTVLFQSQWPTIVRRLQDTVRSILVDAGTDYSYVFTTADGQCRHGVSSTGDNSSLRVNTIQSTGRLDAQTINAVAFLLCHLGYSSIAKQLLIDASKNTISDPVLRFLLWLASFVSPADVDLDKKTVRASVRNAAANIAVYPDASLPLLLVNSLANEDPRNRDFFEATELPAQTALVPNPPSIGGTRSIYSPTASKGLPTIDAGSLHAAHEAIVNKFTPPPLVMYALLGALVYYIHINNKE